MLIQSFGQQSHPIQAIAERSVCGKFEENRSTIAMNNIMSGYVKILCFSLKNPTQNVF